MTLPFAIAVGREIFLCSVGEQVEFWSPLEIYAAKCITDERLVFIVDGFQSYLHLGLSGGSRKIQ